MRPRRRQASQCPDEHLAQRRSRSHTVHQVLVSATIGDEHVSGSRPDDVELVEAVAFGDHSTTSRETPGLQPGQGLRDVLCR